MQLFLLLQSLLLEGDAGSVLRNREAVALQLLGQRSLQTLERASGIQLLPSPPEKLSVGAGREEKGLLCICGTRAILPLTRGK